MSLSTDDSSEDDTCESSEDELVDVNYNSSRDTDNLWHQVLPENDHFDGFPSFTGIHGLNSDINLPEDIENVSFFIDLFFTDELLRHIVDCTNLKAEYEMDKSLEKIGPDGDLPKSIGKWKVCTIAEIKKVIGILFIMAINRKPEMKLYWSQDVI